MFSLARTFKWRQILMGREKRETAKLPFIYLNIALRSPKSLSFTGKIRFVLLSSPNICPSSPEHGKSRCLLWDLTVMKRMHLHSHRPAPGVRKEVTARLRVCYLQHSLVLRIFAIRELAKGCINIKAIKSQRLKICRTVKGPVGKLGYRGGKLDRREPKF